MLLSIQTILEPNLTLSDMLILSLNCCPNELFFASLSWLRYDNRSRIQYFAIQGDWWGRLRCHDYSGVGLCGFRFISLMTDIHHRQTPRGLLRGLVCEPSPYAHAWASWTYSCEALWLWTGILCGLDSSLNTIKCCYGCWRRMHFVNIILKSMIKWVVNISKAFVRWIN